MDDKKQRRVGVITWISYFNFGTYLQAYALQTVVRSLGYACSIVSDEKMVRALRKEVVGYVKWYLRFIIFSRGTMFVLYMACVR